MRPVCGVTHIRGPSDTVDPIEAKAVPDGDMADLYAYLKTLPDSAPSAKSIPLLNQILTAP